MTAESDSISTPSDVQLIAEDLLLTRRQQARSMVAPAGFGVLAVAASLGGDVRPSMLPIGYLGLQLDRRETRFGLGIEGGFFPLITSNPGDSGRYVLPLSIEARYGFGDPLEFYAHGGLSVSFLVVPTPQGPAILMMPSVAVGIGANLALAGRASGYADFGVPVAYAGPGDLLIGVRPSVGLMLKAL